MSPLPPMEAIRLAVALSEPAHVVCLRLTGDDAFDALDVLCPADLYVRDGQMLHTLFLDDEGLGLVDVYVCRDDEDFILLAEGLDVETLVEHIRTHLPEGIKPGIQVLDEDHRLLSVNGPWAWQLMSDLVGPGVMGLPYLSFYHEDRWTCFRAGKTGEFGYDLLVHTDHAEALESALLELGEPLDLARAGQDVLEQCALENWFFNIRREGSVGASPLELQLQWRVSYQKDCVGAAHLAQRREAGAAQRLTCLVSPGPLEIGQPVMFEEQTVGRLVNVGHSTTRGDWVGLALLDRPWAHAGLTGLQAPIESGGASLRTVAPPVIHNRSLFVNAQKHSYQTRGEFDFPPLFDPLED